MTNKPELTDERLAQLVFTCDVSAKSSVNKDVRAALIELQERREAEIKGALQFSIEQGKGVRKLIEGMGGEVLADDQYAWNRDSDNAK